MLKHYVGIQVITYAVRKMHVTMPIKNYLDIFVFYYVTKLTQSRFNVNF